jgi:hypothetical protein
MEDQTSFHRHAVCSNLPRGPTCFLVIVFLNKDTLSASRCKAGRYLMMNASTSSTSLASVGDPRWMFRLTISVESELIPEPDITDYFRQETLV